MRRRARWHVSVVGIVQGVGFRPFVFNLAGSLDLRGWVRNLGDSVAIEVEGDGPQLSAFVERLTSDKPRSSRIDSIETRTLPLNGDEKFSILASFSSENQSLALAPDYAVCADCLGELFDPEDRRYLYPFTNCTLCGPRYSMAYAVPFDRDRTAMNAFPMCSACRSEYEDSGDRRFHSQTHSCFACGPQLSFCNADRAPLASGAAAYEYAIASLSAGATVAVKGMGGYQLWADATNANAVRQLRKNKNREAKPFALMMTTLEDVKSYCEVSPIEAERLSSPEAPIVLLKAKELGNERLAPNLAPGLSLLGVMLPCTPLQHLLMRRLRRPMIATSANANEEPLCCDEAEAFERLHTIAASFLSYNRAILRSVDDSIVRVIGDRPVVFRRARGYVPGVFAISTPKNDSCFLAFGAHLKNTVGIKKQNGLYLSPHLGHLESLRTIERHWTEAQNLLIDHRSEAELAICDSHPDYASTRSAERSGLPTMPVQHHYAHILSCLVDNALSPPVLGVAWDGGGYGPDKSIWGGEFFLIDADYSAQRLAHLRSFPLPGGESAVREPRRALLGLLFEVWGDDLFASTHPMAATLHAMFVPKELQVLRQMLTRKINTPLCSSVGRLFDAIAALCGLRTQCSFEGQAAMELESLAESGKDHASTYSFAIEMQNSVYALDWEPLLQSVFADRGHGVSQADIALGFHRSLAELIVHVTQLTKMGSVVLSGGVFQNRLLTELTIKELRESDRNPVWHKNVPPNDGGIALGQLMAATQRRSGPCV